MARFVLYSAAMDTPAARVQASLVPTPSRDPNIRHFGTWSFVQRCGDEWRVFVRGTLIGRFSDADTATRNVVLVATYNACKRGEVRALAAAFEVSPGTLFNLRKAFEDGGATALVQRTHGGARTRKLTPAKQRRADKLFQAGATVAQVQTTAGLSHGSASRARDSWKQRCEQQPHIAPSVPVEDTDEGEVESIPTVEPRSDSQVQHAGSWLLVAMVAALGLHGLADGKRPAKVRPGLLRLAIDAFVVALAIGECCVEGVRRLGTASAGALLLAGSAPSASWVRRVLHRFADDGNGAGFHLTVAGTLARAAAERDDVAIFYVDNHLRPYSGQQVVRKGWRMQDRRAVRGTTDVYVHDVDGRPVFRFDCPQHDSLTSVLGPVAATLRVALGADHRIILGFDRGGAFPSAMAELREAGIEFVTYERAPYASLAAAEFDHVLEFEDGERIRFCEKHEKNLGAGRGRVRRICLRMQDGHQINVLAIGEDSPERYIEVITSRWRQENAFKHGKERWGINQLDGRRFELVPAGTVIPNPARRRLEHALELAREWEGGLRNRLARCREDDRATVETKLAEAVAVRERYEAQRADIPTHAPVEQTELAGKLVRQDPDYKMALDAIRVVCANAEADLAAKLAPLLPKPAEAKRLLQNVFLSPGSIEVAPDAITVRLNPATTGPERKALGRFFEALHENALSHPADPLRRPLRFSIA